MLSLEISQILVESIKAEKCDDDKKMKKKQSNKKKLEQKKKLRINAVEMKCVDFLKFKQNVLK